MNKSQGYKSQITKILNPVSYSLFSNQGFTLIELLVVIGVIAFVMGVVFPNFMAARQRARDTQRKSNLAQIQNALELYKLDQSTQAYPTTGAFPSSMCNACWDSAGDCSGNIYIRSFPCDPGGSGWPIYIYASLPQSEDSPIRYVLSACLENVADPDKDSTPQPTCAQTLTSYSVFEP